jgi:hypothetical protein
MTETTTDSPPAEPRRRALVTGASGGIGAGYARRLAREGYDLVLVARTREALDSLAKDLRESRGREVEVLVADLTRDEDLRIVEERVAGEPALDLLVNNAGFGSAGDFADADIDAEVEQVRLNVVALMRLTRAALPRMVERGRGSIINVSSLAGLAPLPFSATYGATKAFVTSLTEALHEELRGSGVRVQALCPGFTRTGFQARAGIDAGSIPGFMWMDADAVVEASLAALERDDVLCIPGVGYRLLAGLQGALPRAATRRVIGAAQNRRHQG